MKLDLINTIATAASSIISIIGFYFLYKQLKKTNETLKQSNHTAIYTINTELYKFFAENSDLRPYFHDGKYLTEDNRNKILSVSELLADFFEFILVEKNSVAAEIKEPWINYMKKIYENSPGFRYFIHENKDQYCDQLLNLFANFSPNSMEPEVLCRVILNEEEFEKIDSIYQNAFLSSSVPSDTQKKWWKNQESGIIVLIKNNIIIGGLSYWNLDLEMYKLISHGLIKERELQTKPSLNSNYIYVSDVSIIKEFRKNRYSSLLLKQFILEIELKLKKFDFVLIAAFAFSKEGEIILKKIGFKLAVEADKTKDLQPLYLLRIDSIESINEIKKELL